MNTIQKINVILFLKVVLDFLFKVEQIWPVELAAFSIEFTLEFLMLNKYNHDKVENLIRYKDISFKQFINCNKLFIIFR